MEKMALEAQGREEAGVEQVLKGWEPSLRELKSEECGSEVTHHHWKFYVQ